MTVLPLTPTLRSNFRNLYADIFWYGVLSGSALAFLAVYATRLGANSFQISLLTAGPALINLFLSLPAVRWLEKRPLIQSTYVSAFWHRLGYLALIPLPWLFANPGEIWAILWITLLMSVPATVLAIGFNAMLADVVPPDWRAEVVGKRNALMAVAVTGSTLVCGLLLDRIVFPLNYQIVFGIGFVGAGLSTYHLYRIRPLSGSQPERVNRPLGDLARPGMARIVEALRAPLALRYLTRAKGQALFRFDLIRGPFGLFLLSYLLFYTFQYFSLPLFPLSYVNELHLPDSAIGFGSSLFYIVMLFVSLRLNRLTARYGHHKILAFSAIVFGIYPLLIGLAQDATLYWLASLVGGAVWALVNAGLLNRLMEKVPDQDRPAYMALHNLALNLGILVGSLSGPLVNEFLGLQETLFLGAALRVLAGILLLIWG